MLARSLIHFAAVSTYTPVLWKLLAPFFWGPLLDFPALGPVTASVPVSILDVSVTSNARATAARPAGKRCLIRA